MSDVPEMVLKVARAISGAPFPSAASIAKARKAIEALREPTEAMRYAVWADQYEFNGGSPVEVKFCATRRLQSESQRQQDLQSWSAAIDAALTAPASASERRS